MKCPCRKEVSILLTLLLCSCSSFPAYHPSIKDQLYESEEVASVSGYDRKWWEDLNNSAINILVEKAFDTNPTLEQALAQIDEAKAQSGVSKSEYFPTVGATAGVTQKFDGSTDTGKKSLTTAIGPSLSWEIDLFGRIRNSNKAAKSRLNARTADARNTRNILASSVAGTVFDFQACRYTSFALEIDVESHLEAFNLIHKKVQAGFSPEMEEDLASRDLANTSVNLLTQNELCEKSANALVVLSGMDKTAIQELIEPSRFEDIGDSLPEPPQFPVNIEATALMNHPGVRATEYDAEAARADIGVAKAERLPKLDLLALLSGQWIHAAGTTIDFVGWSLGASISAVLFDGGRGAAKVDVFEARYRVALASLEGALRTAVQEAQDALAAQQSAKKRHEVATIGLMAGQSSFAAHEALWKNGSVSLLELEDSRRQLLAAQINTITAKRDRVAAWIALHRVLGVPTNPQGKSDDKT
jgi:NodT family efflux transporter outer membrane factor (OMF) lipoprotein